MQATTHPRIAEAAATADFGRASARKSGRNPAWPYVPVLVEDPTPSCPKGYTTQILGLAFETRSEAIAAAESKIEAARTALAVKLADPRHRALREQYGLPRELADLG